MTSATQELLAALPETFRYSDALEQISERQLRNLIAYGDIEAISRGLYRKADAIGDDDLAEIAAKSEEATLCLRSALARHNLIDDIPAEYDIAIPRGVGRRRPTLPSDGGTSRTRSTSDANC